MFCPAIEFFQYFNSSNVCLKIFDLIEFFLPKIFPISKKVTLEEVIKLLKRRFAQNLLTQRVRKSFPPKRLKLVREDAD